MDEIWKAVKGSYEESTSEGEGAKVEVYLTSGYFGLYKAYKKAVIDSLAPVRVIAASPKVSPAFVIPSIPSCGQTEADTTAC